MTREELLLRIKRAVENSRVLIEKAKETVAAARRLRSELHKLQMPRPETIEDTNQAVPRDRNR